MNKEIAKRILLLSVVCYAVVMVGLNIIRVYTDKGIKLGVYDPSDSFNTTTEIVLQNEYFDWNVDTSKVDSALDAIFLSKRTPIISLEPWPVREDINNKDYLKTILQGKYDAKIIAFCKTVSSYKSPVYLRWGHEMELKNSRYFWANKNATDFIQSYRYFVDLCRKSGDTIQFIWSPAGDKGLENYWPGAEFVDVIGVTVYSYDKWDKMNYGYQRSFNEIFNEKYTRVKVYNKPVYISEVGVTGTSEYRFQWLTDAKKNFDNYPLLKAFVYFNAVDIEGVWGVDVDTPVWEIEPHVFVDIFK
ncbi:MAG: hypothetical protein RLY61_637 [Candidatus Parcubacteria bacterium]|jgi:cellulose synthase (UDP-forming)